MGWWGIGFKMSTVSTATKQPLILTCKPKTNEYMNVHKNRKSVVVNRDTWIFVHECAIGVYKTLLAKFGSIHELKQQTLSLKKEKTSQIICGTVFIWMG